MIHSISALENKHQAFYWIIIVRRRSQRAKANAKAKTIKWQLEEIKEKKSNIKENFRLQLHHGTNWIIRTLWIIFRNVCLIDLNQHVKTSHTAYVFKLWWWWWWWRGFCRTVTCHLIFDIRRKNKRKRFATEWELCHWEKWSQRQWQRRTWTKVKVSVANNGT